MAPFRLLFVLSPTCLYDARVCESINCTAQMPLARDLDCDGADSECLVKLNALARQSRTNAFVWGAKVMKNMVSKRLRKMMAEKGVADWTWKKTISRHYCETFDVVALPTYTDVDRFKQRLAALRGNTGVEPVLLYEDDTSDGIGARMKKALELVATALHLDFFGVIMTLASESVQCHTSPAASPAEQDPRNPTFSQICWYFDIEADFFGQTTNDPATRTLLWGAPPVASMLKATMAPARRFNCFGFTDASLEEGGAWKLLGKLERRPQALQRVVDSARMFAPIARSLEPRPRVLCGFSEIGFVHVAIHIRRGDTGDDNDYSVTDRLGADNFQRWLCELWKLLGSATKGQSLSLHVYTEASGLSRGAFRRHPPRGFTLAAEPGDDEQPIHHMHGHFAALPKCETVKATVHFAVNDNPLDALTCMARADVLITSFSSLSWIAAVLAEGPVFHPSGSTPYPQEHWDLRDQYLDWADNWFRADLDQVDAGKVQAMFERGEKSRRGGDWQWHTGDTFTNNVEL